jgi:hypothetical protein
MNTYGQHLHIIRFIHGGDEIQPIGTVIISVEKVIPLIDKPTDSLFGRSIKTDIKTFRLIRKLIKNKKYYTPHETAADRLDFLRITDSDGFVLGLFASKYKMFFYDLRSLIEQKKGDQTVIEAFDSYYW